MNNAETLPEILTVPEIAKRLKISRNMVYKLIDMGQLRCYRIGTAYGCPGTSLSTT